VVQLFEHISATKADWVD